MYHYVRVQNEELPNFSFLHFDDFKRQLDYFQSNYILLHPDSLLEEDTDDESDKIVLTFDDGLKDHFEYVYPELKSRGLSGLFYISSGPFLTNKILDVHRIHLLIGRICSKDILEYLDSIIKIEMFSEHKKQQYRNTTYKNQISLEQNLEIKRILNYYLNRFDREFVIDKLWDKFMNSFQVSSNDFYLNEFEIKTMFDSGMRFGSHSNSHEIMSSLSLEQQHDEILKSFEILNDFLGDNLVYKSFCYPFGGIETFTKETIDLLNKNNIDFSFYVYPQKFSLKTSIKGNQMLPRYDCNMFEHGQIYRQVK